MRTHEQAGLIHGTKATLHDAQGISRLAPSQLAQSQLAPLQLAPSHLADGVWRLHHRLHRPTARFTPSPHNPSCACILIRLHPSHVACSLALSGLPLSSIFALGLKHAAVVLKSPGRAKFGNSGVLFIHKIGPPAASTSSGTILSVPPPLPGTKLYSTPKLHGKQDPQSLGLLRSRVQRSQSGCKS